MSVRRSNASGAVGYVVVREKVKADGFTVQISTVFVFSLLFLILRCFFFSFSFFLFLLRVRFNFGLVYS